MTGDEAYLSDEWLAGWNVGLYVFRSGLATTVQDRGRRGRRGLGVPESGAFDRSSFQLANALVGNGLDAAALELTILGGTFFASGCFALALAGPEIDARVERHDGSMIGRLGTPGSFTLNAGERLVLGAMSRGARLYLAAAGGFPSPVVLGSRSSELPIKVDHCFALRPATISRMRPSGCDFPDPLLEPIRLLDGPDAPVPRVLLDHSYRVSAESDRRGVRLDGPSLEGFEQPGRPSAPVAPGALQVAGGKPIVLGPAGGTMGGYPHVAHVVSADLDRLGQARPGDWLRFGRVDLDEARRLDVARLADLDARDRRIALLAGAAISWA